MGAEVIKKPEILCKLSIPEESILIDDFALTLNAIRNSTCFEFLRKDVSVYRVTNIFEVESVELINGGVDYQVNDILSFDIGLLDFCLIKVTNVDGLGKVLSVEVVSGGRYEAEPTNPVEATNAGGAAGNGAEFNLRLKKKCRVQFINDYLAKKGLSIFLKSGMYSQKGMIIGIGNDDGFNYFDTDIDFVTTTSGGYINISDKKNYEIEVKLFYGYNKYEEYSHLLRTTPSVEGLAVLDISGPLRNICSKINKINYENPLTQDLTNSGMFYIEYREIWKNYKGGWIKSENYWQYLFSVLQPPRPIYDNIMQRNEMSFSRDTEFLTSFEKPKYYVNYPFSVSYFSHILFIDDALQLFNNLKYKNINKKVEKTELINLGNANNFGLMHLNISNIDCSSEYFSVQLSIGDGSCDDNCYVEPDYVECGYVGCGYGRKEDPISPPEPPPIYPPSISF